MDMIVCQNLTKQFGTLTSVDNLNLRVGEGELFGFLGPNGAGKTTSIKMMTGLIHPTSGTAFLGGYDIQTHPREAKRLIGYIPDNPFLYEKLTGREFIHFMADLYAVPGDNRAARIEDLLRLFELESKGDELIQNYSRGMRQKIALAGALIHAPQIIFLDEPTVGLDPQSAHAMQDILRALCRRGVTVFLSTHVLEIAERMCDRIGIIHQGRLLAVGAMEELRALRNAHTAQNGHADDERKNLTDIFFELTGSSDIHDRMQYLD
jgi:ABC-2 type transport system ATP-binding protein